MLATSTQWLEDHEGLFLLFRFGLYIAITAPGIGGL
jgi:hypothetical protein